MTAIIKQSLITFTLVIVSLLLVEGIGHIDFSNGNLLFLPMGAEILAYLLFGFRVLPGVVIANTLVGYFLWNNWMGSGIDGFYGHVMIGSLAPVIAIIIMKSCHLPEFFKDGKLIFRNVLFLIILTGMVNTLSKFFLFMSVLKTNPDPIVFLSTYLVGDILGGIVFIYVAIKIFTPQLIKYRSI